MKRSSTVVTIMPNKILPNSPTLVDRLKADFPAIDFVESSGFSWHAGQNNISYKAIAIDDTHGSWALLHEVGHALLEHKDFNSDIELLKMEVAAWEQAKQLAATYSTKIDEEYVQSCIDSYRDWLHVRSTCPTCHSRSLQTDKRTYCCLNCDAEWKVTRNRLCRPYRRRG